MTIYLCLIGEFDADQTRVLDCTAEYLALFFDVPVRIHRRVPLSVIPARARRKHPQWNDKQLLTPYLLQELLEPDRPDDALAYLALTARDLWPGHGWNFVFGEANLRRRVAVCSIYRNGYPGKSDTAFRLCLRRTLMIAAHETGHILTMQHCTAYRCLMNGCNNQEERDRTPLHLCPVCLRTGMDHWAPAYSISKAALNAVTRQFAAALKEQGVAVNSACPGWVRTDMGGANATRSVEQGTEGIVWLATEAPQSLTGQFLRDREQVEW